MNWTQEQLDEFYRNRGQPSIVNAGAQPRTARKPKREVYDGPIDETLELWGHCPSKKNLWQRARAGKMFLSTEVKAQIDTLTTQAMFLWKQRPPIEHPEITVTFFVRDARRDRDGMFTTLLDCLQAAGVLVNDNIAHNGGRTVLEPCQFVEESQEHTVIRIVRE